MPDNDDAPRVIVRDKRKVDADGHVRDLPPEDHAADLAAPVAETGLLAERTADLQRLKAEYDNYRKRVERDRELAAQIGTAAVLAQLIPVLDDIDRAREHGAVEGGFKSVADALDGALGKVGLVRFGAVGDAFDPALHEAVMHQHDDSVTAPTCVTIMRPGYLFAERLLRPAMVAVAEPPEADTLLE